MQRRLMTRVGIAIAAAAVALTGCAPSAPTSNDPGADDSPRTYKLATYVAPTAPHGKTLVWLIDEAAKRSDGKVIIDPYYNGELLPADELLAGVVDGRADLTFMTPQYSPAELPLSQITSIPFVTADMAVLAGALADLAEHSDTYQQEWDQAGVVPLAFAASAPSMFAATEPVPGVDWLAGKSIRAAGQAATAVQAAGGNAVSLVVGDLYESIERGLVAGYTSMIFDAVPSLSLEEVAPHIVDTGLGTYTFNVLAANAARWGAMPEADRELIAELAREFDDRYRANVAIGEDEACEIVLAIGGTVSVWPEEETEKWQERVGTEPRDVWQSAAEQAGAPAAEFYDEYMAAIDAASSAPSPSGMARCAAAH
ncbi:MAG TPA: TRAP transporter substrate-binding protein DctP [Microbacteriaceae bacterium]|nr:TRAP transporter substrate-binding protein DctP [Microbacteriaceae bacterium]